MITSCGKVEQIQIEPAITHISDQPLHDIMFLNDTIGFSCSGNSDGGGRIYQWKNGAWNKVYETDREPIRSLANSPSGKLFAGGDFVHLFSSNNGGDTWGIDWLDSDELATHEIHRTSIDALNFINDSVGYFVGGDNYNHGQVYYTRDNGQSWSFDTLNHEISGLCSNNNGDSWVCGYGYVGRIKNQTSLEQLPSFNDNFKAIHCINSGDLVLIGNSGKAYFSEDSGLNWTRRSAIKGINVISSAYHEGTWIVCGSFGTCFVSYDHGNEWKQIELNTDTHFNAVRVFKNTVFLAGTDGKLYSVSLTAIS